MLGREAGDSLSTPLDRNDCEPCEIAESTGRAQLAGHRREPGLGHHLELVATRGFEEQYAGGTQVFAQEATRLGLDRPVVVERPQYVAELEQQRLLRLGLAPG